VTRPLSARSVIASTLLGTVPPRLPGRLLVALADQFAITEGTTRVALSRMVERGELVNDDGTYCLAGDLLARHHRQEEGLRPATRPWDGGWTLHVVDGRSRTSADRSALRRAFGHLRVFEQREGVWLRPDNLDPDRLPVQRGIVEAQTHRYVAHPEDDPNLLAAQLFDLGGWAERAAQLEREMEATAAALDRVGPEALAPGFVLSAEVLRHLLTDPLFPPVLWPPDRPAERLRHHYGTYDDRYRAELARFFSAATVGR
jgi:phenylacetic acid degradation operon negative regulatory protein